MKHDKSPIAIIGAAGLTGKELLTLLSRHPRLKPVHITSNQHAGLPLSRVYPALEGMEEIEFCRHDDPIPEGIPVLLAVPNETSMALVPRLLEKGHRVVDLSGAFRLHDRAIFEKYYRLEHTSFETMKEAVYGIPEIFRDTIRTAHLVANPGCFPTAAILPIYYMESFRSRMTGIYIDAKSGVSGAGGRTEDAGYSFNSVHENFRAYKILRHQHQPEIQEYSAQGMKKEFPFPIIFTPHLLPLYRGILATTVIQWDGEAPENLRDHLLQHAAPEPFIRLLQEPEEVELSRVQNSNFLDFAVRSEGNTSVVVSAIDNLVKGAAGQAIQNLNLMLGLDERTGLLM